MNDSCVENCLYVEKETSEVAVDDASAGMFVVVLLFMLPSRLNFWPFSRIFGREPATPSPALLSWQAIHDRMPWALLLLMGGGFALSKATRQAIQKLFTTAKF